MKKKGRERETKGRRKRARSTGGVRKQKAVGWVGSITVPMLSCLPGLTGIGFLGKGGGCGHRRSRCTKNGTDRPIGSQISINRASGCIGLGGLVVRVVSAKHLGTAKSLHGEGVDRNKTKKGME
jgi:hypothetical protein